MNEISPRPENELTDRQLETISGGGGGDKSNDRFSETVSSKDGGMVSGRAGETHLGGSCAY
ncbi:hypothetical protein [Bradyrhizobium sp. STM 3809]|uniref:hypothetical protein n=1 Tax=Bradyrhizobium sp. STM 3809 TaxID=551936 RepID=UPI0002409D23|nr:hypothetical protein [Bradyrhizobium sp. STM 3809]CCE01685.1 conserved hypothetical protein [Bradyrhizobium sp. STM 3809]